MTSSFTASSTFTITDAKYVASKMGADLRNLNARYGQPSLAEIDDYVLEAALCLKAGYLNTVDFGFRDGERWILRLRYTAVAGGQLNDQTPGGLPAAADIQGRSFYSFLRWNGAFTALGSDAQHDFKATLPVTRTPGAELGTGIGTHGNGTSYARNGVGLSRDVFSAI